MTDAFLRLPDHAVPGARRIVDAVRRALATGTPEGDRIDVEGRTLRLDDGCDGHAGLVLAMPPPDTGPFADRDREIRVHVHDAALLARVGAMPIADGVRAILDSAERALRAATSARTLPEDHPDALAGARYAGLLAFERSLAMTGLTVATSVRHPWSGATGAEGGSLPRGPLRVPLRAIAVVAASWDAVDMDLVVCGLQHHASVAAADDPVGALRAVAELRRTEGK